jgi:hypothetical protein
MYVGVLHVVFIQLDCVPAVGSKLSCARLVGDNIYSLPAEVYGGLLSC